MRWLNPAALVGLLAVAVPVLVHLFGRRIAKRQRFPTLRLFREVKSTPVTRSTPSDLLLLLLRGAVIVAAALGLAQPGFTGSDRAGMDAVRAIIVDTSASMLRLTSDRAPARDRARAAAPQLLDSARQGVIIETPSAGAALGGAASWLDGRSGRRELVIVSDFQRGAVSEGDFANVPDDIGIRLLRVSATSLRVGADSTRIGVVPMNVDSIGIEAAWRPPMADTVLPVAVLAADGDRAGVNASISAVLHAVPIRNTSIRKVAVVFPGYPDATRLLTTTAPLSEPWQGDMLERLTRNELMRAAPRDRTALAPCPGAGVPLRNAAGDVLAHVTGTSPGSAHDMLVLVCAAPGTLTGTSVLAATVATFSAFPPLEEYETVELPDELLQKWNRVPREEGPPGADETSPGGRWFWLAALILLAAEEWIRRRASQQSAAIGTGERHARVA